MECAQATVTELADKITVHLSPYISTPDISLEPEELLICIAALRGELWRSVKRDPPPTGQWVIARGDGKKLDVMYRRYDGQNEWIATTGHTTLINPGSTFTPSWWQPLSALEA